ncbi:alpha/beta fold hydrolase [Stappia indica]|uniref:alpha/beta fold hydrolase n=1 Tax=Stappia indica TaxID=538381 RepID=UPI001CD80FE5|nr:alpha/beta fold hydrolase [Stappia indica]MCA1297620.1 alpha/beta fold hydrolase [Stappia indica]
MSDLHIRRRGQRAAGKRPVVLLHGWSCHGGFMAPQLAALGRETLVLAPDLPGHGESRSLRPFTIEAAADAVMARIEAEGLDEVVLHGWSMGALVAWSLIERHGTDRLAALVVEDMSPKVLNGPDWDLGTLSDLDARRNAVFLRALEKQWPALVRPTALKTFAADLDPASPLIRHAEEEMRKADPAALAAMWASLTAQDFRALMPAIDIPVVLAPGGKSQLYDSRAARWQQSHLPRARIVPFSRSGHAPHLEEAEAFNTLLSGLATR